MQEKSGMVHIWMVHTCITLAATSEGSSFCVHITGQHIITPREDNMGVDTGFMEIDTTWHSSR
jgi:hypothetical protein